MNGKKAKKLRQLTRQLQSKGIVNAEWQVDGSVDHTNLSELRFGKTSVLKPDCGKAVYRQMKARA